MPVKQYPTGPRQRLRQETVRMGAAVSRAAAKVKIKLHKHKNRMAAAHWFYLLGEAFYQLGFGAEYTAVRLLRSLGGALVLLGRMAGGAAARAGRFALDSLAEAAEDLLNPFTGMIKGMLGICRTAEEGQLGAYLAQGMRRYLHMWGRLVSYALPAVAAVVFAAAVQDKLGRQYALAVECDGRVVGYVANELVFDQARDEVKKRIVLAQDQDWNVEPTFVVAAAEDVMDVNRTADAILRTSANEIREAVGLEVDGRLVAITGYGDRLRQYLDEWLAKYTDPENPNLRAEFVEKVELVDGLYATSSLRPFGEIQMMLEGEREQQQTYVIQPGDTPSGVASRFDLTMAQLTELNPKIGDNSYNWPIGDTLTVHQSVKFLQVKTIETIVEEQVITLPAQSVESSDLAWGTSRVKQENVDGLDQVTREEVRIGGILVENNELERIHLKEAQPRIVENGTRLPDGGVAQLGTGQYVWPVPQYKYVSQKMSGRHRGTDIASNRGTAILAMDNGVVVRAGWNAAGSGYGNSIVIQHSPGVTTLYAHCHTLNVRVGQSVSKGQVIATVGNTGYSFGNHLHLEITAGGRKHAVEEYFGGLRYNFA